MKVIGRLIAILSVAAAICGCKEGSRKALLPNVSGKAGEVMVVIEKFYWENTPGTVLRDSLTQDCPFLPQKEPLFNLSNVAPGGFNQMFQIHRNIIIVNISAGVNAPGVSVLNDKWAHPQIVICVNAQDADQATELLQKNMHKMINVLEQAERDRVIANTQKYQETALSSKVGEFIPGAHMVFPSGWSLKKRTEDFMWLSYETTYVQQGVFIYKYPATGVKEELGIDALVQRRNDVLRREVPGMLDGSYMTTSAILRPALKYASYRDLKFAQMKGFWDVHGDFMGGPFVSHTFYSPDGSELICTEAYVYAPKFDKRNYMRQAEALLYSFKWGESNDLKK